MDQDQNNNILRIEPGDELDLHHFHPRDVKQLLHEFLEISLAAGINTVRIVHGKGRSVIKGIVHAELSKISCVIDFHDQGGNWGATIVRLNSTSDKKSE